MTHYHKVKFHKFVRLTISALGVLALSSYGHAHTIKAASPGTDKAEKTQASTKLAQPLLNTKISSAQKVGQTEDDEAEIFDDSKEQFSDNRKPAERSNIINAAAEGSSRTRTLVQDESDEEDYIEEWRWREY